MDVKVAENEIVAAGLREEAVEILLTVRRRLTKRLAVAVVMNRQQLIGRGNLLNAPLTCDRDLAAIAAGLHQVDQAIAALKPVPAGLVAEAESPYGVERGTNHHRNGTFNRFAQLVAEKRLEEASRELSQTLQMPLDRAVTATQFFARATRVNPDSLGALAVLHEQTTAACVADGIRLLMKTFGFQAVESRSALETLRSKRQSLGGIC